MLHKYHLERVEGEVRIEAEVDGSGVVTNAQVTSSKQRLLERQITGRHVTDAPPLAARICGICSTAQSLASQLAVEEVLGVIPTPQGVRARNFLSALEISMSDLLHLFGMFLPDFCHNAYRGHPLYSDLVYSFSTDPYRGYALLAYRQIARLKKAFQLLCGMWPHSTWLRLGGVSFKLTHESLQEVRRVIEQHATWYEDIVLGCSIERWLQIQTWSQLEEWLHSSPSTSSALRLFTLFSRDIGLHLVGHGAPNLLSGGSFRDPQHPSQSLRRGGFWDGSQLHPFSHLEVTEDTHYSFYEKIGPVHPFDSTTIPNASVEREKEGAYSHIKATRYHSSVVQVGPAVDLCLGGDRLMSMLMHHDRGPNTWWRELARFHRGVLNIELMRHWLREMEQDLGEAAYVDFSGEVKRDRGVGITNATRGTLMTFLVVGKRGEVTNCQIVTPTAINFSSQDHEGNRGHGDLALLGRRFSNLDHPVELDHGVRDLDPCLVCAAHVFLGEGRVLKCVRSYGHFH